jgi:hypothetical protein
MKRLILAVLFYVIACPLILNIHRLSPTNMAGPGWDIVIYFLSAVITIALLTISLIKIKSDNKLSYLNLFLNIVGSFVITFLLYQELTTRW